MHRTIEVVNLDPAAEHFDYTPLVDIRELIQVQDTMEDDELHFGPNGTLHSPNFINLASTVTFFRGFGVLH